MAAEKRITTKRQLEGAEVFLDGAWRKVGTVTGPHKPQFGARGSFYRVKLMGGEYRDRSGRIYPDCLHVWRGDFLRVRKGGASC